jgi:hypothetical protein
MFEFKLQSRFHTFIEFIGIATNFRRFQLYFK